MILLEDRDVEDARAVQIEDEGRSGAPVLETDPVLDDLRLSPMCGAGWYLQPPGTIGAGSTDCPAVRFRSA